MSAWHWHGYWDWNSGPHIWKGLYSVLSPACLPPSPAKGGLHSSAGGPALHLQRLQCKIFTFPQDPYHFFPWGHPHLAPHKDPCGSTRARFSSQNPPPRWLTTSWMLVPATLLNSEGPRHTHGAHTYKQVCTHTHKIIKINKPCF